LELYQSRKKIIILDILFLTKLKIHSIKKWR